MANTPTYILYHGRNTSKDKDGKKIWTRIGAVWPNKDGRGFNGVLDVVPLDGRLILREPLERENAGGMQSSEMV